MIIRYFLIALFFISSASFAEGDPYRWRITDSYYSNHPTDPIFSSASDACAWAFAQEGFSGSYFDSFTAMVITSTMGHEMFHPDEGFAFCALEYSPYMSDSFSAADLRRVGSECPSNHSWSERLGECIPDEGQCDIDVGSPDNFEFLYCHNYGLDGDDPDGCSDGTQIPQPHSFCRNSCTYIPDFDPSTTDADCYSYQNIDGTFGPSVMCSVTGYVQQGARSYFPNIGRSCGADTLPPQPDNECPIGLVMEVVDNKNVCVVPPEPEPEEPEQPECDEGTIWRPNDDGVMECLPERVGGGGNTGGGDTGGGNTGGGDTGGGNTGGGSTGGGDTGGGNTGGGDGNGDGNGDGDGAGDGDGSGEGAGLCPDGDCDFGDGRGDPFGGDVRSFSDSLTYAMDGIKTSPLASSISSISFPSSGVCPTGSTTFSLPFGSFDVDYSSHCSLWEQIAPILSAVFLALWAFLAVRVFLSA